MKLTGITWMAYHRPATLAAIISIITYVGVVVAMQYIP